jgi:hypothetical protein
MRFSINLFDEVRFVLGYRRDAGGVLVLEKTFVEFLERPKHPHISLFLNPGKLEPHFTAARGRPEQRRVWLPAVRPADAARVAKDATSSIMHEFTRVIEAADLLALEQEGWSLHFADFQAIARWLKRRVRGTSELRFDNDVAATLALHVIRHCDLPTAARLFPGDAFVRAVLIRWNESGEPAEIRPLVHFPDGVAGLHANGEPFLAHPPGWYMHSRDWSVDEVLARAVPIAKLEAVGERVARVLSRYPRRKQETDEELPAWAMSLATYYASEIVDMAFALVLEASESRRTLARSA